MIWHSLSEPYACVPKEATVGTSNYARLRFGIGSEFAKGHQVNYVLNKWNADENKALPERLNQCCEFIKSFASIGAALTMSQFNNK